MEFELRSLNPSERRALRAERITEEEVKRRFEACGKGGND